MAELEANLLKAMNIPLDDQPTQIYGSNRKGTRPAGGAAGTASGSTGKSGKSNSRTRREDSPSKQLNKAGGRQPMANRPQQKTVLSRKYSDNKYDKPEVDARIEQQTLKALESLGLQSVTTEVASSNQSSRKQENFAIEANHLKYQATAAANRT